MRVTETRQHEVEARMAPQRLWRPRCQQRSSLAQHASCWPSLVVGAAAKLAARLAIAPACDIQIRERHRRTTGQQRRVGRGHRARGVVLGTRGRLAIRLERIQERRLRLAPRRLRLQQRHRASLVRSAEMGPRTVDLVVRHQQGIVPRCERVVMHHEGQVAGEAQRRLRRPCRIRDVSPAVRATAIARVRGLAPSVFHHIHHALARGAHVVIDRSYAPLQVRDQVF